MLLELPPIPGSSKTASQDAKCSTSKLLFRFCGEIDGAGIGEGGGDEEDVRLVVRTIPSRVNKSESPSDGTFAVPAVRRRLTRIGALRLC